MREKREAGRRAAAWACAVWLVLSMKLENPGKSQILLNLIASFRGFDSLWLLALPGLYWLFHRAEGLSAPGKGWRRGIPACFFALNMILGDAFAREGSAGSLLTLRDGQLAKALLVGAAWGLVFDRLLGLLYAWMDGVNLTGRAAGRKAGGGLHPLRWYGEALARHPFLTAMMTLVICYLPHFWVAYPAMFMGDTGGMVVQGYSQLGMTGVTYLSPGQVMRSGIYINQHHPAFYTLCLHGFLRLGEAVFHSLNAGIFLLALAQALLMLFALAWAVSSLARCGVSEKVQVCLLAYAVLHPPIRNYLFLVTKDGAYTACFILMMTGLFRWRRGMARRRDLVLTGLAALGVLLLRNEGRYVLLLAGALMCLADRAIRKRMLCVLLATMAAALGIYQGLYPALGYTRGGRQEALSVPFQQTARYLREHPDQVTAEERAAIDGVLDFDRLAELYQPENADPVKATFRQEAGGAALMAYFRAWVRMGLRHPETYVQATYGNYYQYLYPGEGAMSYYGYGWSAWMCELTNDMMAGLGKGFSLPEWNRRARYISDSLVDAGLMNLPPFSWMMNAALYCWGLIALFFWAAGRGKERGALWGLMTPLLTAALVLFAGPCNGFYSRYNLPLTAFLPFLAVMLVSMRGEGRMLAKGDQGEYHEAGNGKGKE